MRNLIVAAMLIVASHTAAQNNTTANIIEGGKTLVELVRVFKTPKIVLPQQTLVEKKDSCSIKNITDLCLKNSTVKPLLVSLYRRNGNAYDAIPLTMKVLPKNQEWLYELKAGVYKMKLETEDSDGKKLFREGDVKLSACENLIKEIREE